VCERLVCGRLALGSLRSFALRIGFRGGLLAFAVVRARTASLSFVHGMLGICGGLGVGFCRHCGKLAGEFAISAVLRTARFRSKPGRIA
jgi:hypothetical protein